MGRLDLFKTSINSTLDRKYLLEKWIGDDSLVTILKDNYALDFINKRYINRYLPVLSLQDYKVFNVRIHRVKNIKNDKIILLLHQNIDRTYTSIHQIAMGGYLQQFLYSLLCEWQ